MEPQATTIRDLELEAWRYAEQDWRVTAGHRQKLTRKDAMRIAYYDGLLRGMRIREEISSQNCQPPAV